MNEFRAKLVETALEWERAYGNAPSITTALSELDAAALLGMSEGDYREAMKGATSVQRGHDFILHGKRVQVKGTRPSGKPGSRVTKVPNASNYEWDQLVWVSYNPRYEVQEAWLWEVADYEASFSGIKRLSPDHMRRGRALAGGGNGA